jgi:biotin transporter BioY
MNPEQTFLPGMITTSLFGVLPPLPGDVVKVVLAALITLILRDRLGGELP